MTDERRGDNPDSNPPEGVAPGQKTAANSATAAAAGADPADVHTNIGARDGVVPASYGASGGLADDHGDPE